MQVLEVTWKHAAQIWWSWTWRTLVIMLPVSFFLGAIGAFTLLSTNVPVEENMIWFQIVAMVIAVYVGIAVMKKLLQMKFKGFRLALIKDEPSASTSDC